MASAEAKHIPSELYGAMLYGKGAYSFSPWNKATIISQAYERNAPFYSAVNIIAQTIAQMPIFVEYSFQGRRNFASEHPIMRVLDRNEPIQQFIERLVTYYLVTGDGFAEIVESTTQKETKPLGVIVMPSQFTRGVQGTYRKPIIEYEYTETGTIKIPFHRVIHVSRPSLSRYFESMSPATPLQETIDLHNAAITWNKNVALAGGMPPLVAKMRGLSREQAVRIQNDWQADSGASNAHRLKVAHEGMEFERLTDTPNDAEWEHAILQTMRMIFMAFGVSSSLMNDAANKTYNNVHDARKSLYTEACIPIAERIYSAITRKLQPYYRDNPVIKIDADRIDALQEDKKILMERLDRGVNAGILSANEARAELGFPAAVGPTANMLQNARIINNIPKVNGRAETETEPKEDELELED